MKEEPDATTTEAKKARDALEAVGFLHRRSLFVASTGEHKGRHYCPTCTVSVDDFTAYVDWPCATATILAAAVAAGSEQ